MIASYVYLIFDQGRGQKRMPRLLFLLLLLGGFSLSACNIRQAEPLLPTANAQNIIYVTATPLPATVAAVATAVPTAPPPAIDASQLLGLGDSYLRNGNYEEAAGVYRTLLNHGAAIVPEQRAAAAFSLGQAALRASYYQPALEAFNLFIGEFPASPGAAQAYFLRGAARLGLAQWQAASADFQQYLALRPGLIDSYVYERIADAQIALGQTEVALGNFELAIQAGRSKVPLLILREKLARIYLEMGRFEAAIAQYDAILVVARNAPYRATIAFSAAQAALTGGATAAGIERMAAIFADYSGTATAWQALTVLSQQGISYDGWQRGKAAYSAGDYQAAVDAFNEYRAARQPAALPAELFLLLGRAYRQLGNSEAATVAFQTVIDYYPQDPLFGAALLERGRTRFLAGDSPTAIQFYLAIADSYPELAAAAGEALWRAGYLYGTNGETALSRQTFTRLADSYPNHELTTNGLFIAASAAVRDEEWALAETLYRRIAALTSGADQAAAYLWLGRIALTGGAPAVADEAFAQAVAAAPDSYFAARAADFRRGQPPFAAPAAWQFDFDESAERAVAEDWLRRVFALEETGELWHLSPALNSDPRLIRGRELYAVGAFDAAFTEFEDLVDEARETGAALHSYQLAVYLRDLGSYRESIIAAADVIIAAKAGTLQAPPFLARLRFPAYFIDLIQPEAAARGIDPALMLSLIRQESLFNTHATAAAGEIGLMQVIPSTAQYIAERLAWPDYQHSDLFRPQAGIAFGAYYIDEQLDLFEQNAIAALAAYNAGPGRAYDWHALSSDDPDLFMTTITIDSTRHYVQNIYRNYNIYRALYGRAAS